MRLILKKNTRSLQLLKLPIHIFYEKQQLSNFLFTYVKRLLTFSELPTSEGKKQNGTLCTLSCPFVYNNFFSGRHFALKLIPIPIVCIV